MSTIKIKHNGVCFNAEEAVKLGADAFKKSVIKNGHYDWLEKNQRDAAIAEAFRLCTEAAKAPETLSPKKRRAKPAAQEGGQ